MNILYEYKEPKSILTKTKGFIDSYTHSLNPYSGCSFGCSYCYVRQMPIGLYSEKEWGTWITIKENSATILEKELVKEKKKGKVTIFMSSSTDPYQPIEYKLGLTRKLLTILLENKPDFLMVQTRSPLVTRDIDLFKQFGDSICVSITVETDLERIRKIFTPAAPPIQARLRALKKLKEEGIPNQIAISPVLPCTNSFPLKIKDIVDRVCLDSFFLGDGSGGKRTEALGMRKIFEENGLEKWYSDRGFRHVLEQLKKTFPPDKIRISKHGFAP